MSIIPQRWVVTRSQVTSVLLNPIYLDEPSLNWTHNWYYSLPPPPWNASCPAFLTFLLLLFPANYSLLSFYGSFTFCPFLKCQCFQISDHEPIPFSFQYSLWGIIHTPVAACITTVYTHPKAILQTGIQPRDPVSRVQLPRVSSHMGIPWVPHYEQNVSPQIHMLKRDSTYA